MGDNGIGLSQMFGLIRYTSDDFSGNKFKQQDRDMRSVVVSLDYRSCQTVVSLVNISYMGCLNSYILINLAIDGRM